MAAPSSTGSASTSYSLAKPCPCTNSAGEPVLGAQFNRLTYAVRHGVVQPQSCQSATLCAAQSCSTFTLPKKFRTNVLADRLRFVYTDSLQTKPKAACQQESAMSDGADRRPTRRSPEDYRDFAILRIAARQFREHGFHGTSMQDIADAAGIQKGSLYHHFSGKEEILFRIIDYAARLLLDPLRAIAASRLPADVQLHKAMRNHVLGLCQHRDSLSVLLFESRALNEPLRRQAAQERWQYEELFCGILRRGIEAGRFWPSEPKLTAYALFGMGNWLVQWYRPDGPLEPAALAEFFADLALAAVTGDRSLTPPPALGDG